MTGITIGERALTVEDVALAAHGRLPVTVAAPFRERMAAARATLDDHLANEIPVYGLNTGLGSNLAHRIDAKAAADNQAALVLGRVAGIGAALPVETCRAILFCRIAGLAQGGAGISLDVFDLLCAMLAQDIVPVIPSRGSTGASDLVQTMSIAAAAIGEGMVYVAGEVRPAGEALGATGLRPARLAAKDGLSIGSASSVTVATAALALSALGDLVTVHVAVASLACEGFGASPHVFDGDVAAMRPAARQVEAAHLFRKALADSDASERKYATVQDALSFRALPQVTGLLLHSLESARREVEVELNHSADNPIVLVETGTVRSSANFMTGSISLAFDTLAIATAQLAAASAQRSIKLMTGRLSGLPNYLSPLGGASAGYVPIQKSIAALMAEIRLKATPASLDALVVSEMIEDLGTNSVLAISKFTEQLEALRWLIAIEAMIAAQAVDLRKKSEPGSKLGVGSAEIYRAVREVVPMLVADRPTGPDATLVHQRLWQGGLQQSLGELLR